MLSYVHVYQLSLHEMKQLSLVVDPTCFDGFILLFIGNKVRVRMEDIWAERGRMRKSGVTYNSNKGA